MKISSFVLVLLLISGIFLTGCGVKNADTINYNRKLGKYITTGNQSTVPVDTIDLSEGPSLKYQSNLGRKDVNIEFKIVNPY